MSDTITTELKIGDRIKIVPPPGFSMPGHFREHELWEIVPNTYGLAMGDPGVLVDRTGDLKIKPWGSDDSAARYFLTLDWAQRAPITDTVAPSPTSTNEEISSLRQQLAAMTEEKNRMQSVAADRFSALQNSQQAHRSDIEIIGEALLGEASDRDWCSEYDTIVERLNERLTVELPTRQRDYEVTIYFRQRIMVTAADEDDAIEKAREMDGYGENLNSDDEYESADVETI